MIKNHVSKVVAALTILAAAQLFVTSAYADTRECVKEYGGGETCITKKGDLEVVKKIKNPKTGDFEDNIKPSGGSNPYRFSASEKITFSIVVKNKGDIKVENIKLEDILPSFVKYSSGDGDGKDDDSKVSFDKFSLDAGEEKEFIFKAKIESDGILPKDNRLCLTNVAKAKGELADSDDTVSDIDSADFCIELPKVKGKESPKTLPVTGAFGDETSNLILAGSISAGLILVGYGLKKLAD